MHKKYEKSKAEYLQWTNSGLNYVLKHRYCEREGNNMIKVGIIGSTGYAGAELVRILTGHKEAEIVWYGSRSYVDQNSMRMYTAICSRS